MKPCQNLFQVKAGAAFNWTKVELKPPIEDLEKEVEDTFNWTKVELKPLCEKCHAKYHRDF